MPPTRPAEPTPPLPPGPFDLVIADCPWSYSFSARSRSAPVKHYQTMTLGEIQALGDPLRSITARDSILLLWATSPLLPEALSVMEAWGFRYKTSAVWWKTGRPGLGYYWRQDAEYLLLGTRGQGLGAPPPALRVSNVMPFPRREHSRKPDELLFPVLESWWPAARRLEMFARRNDRPHAWTVWGLEAPAASVAPSGHALAA